MRKLADPMLFEMIRDFLTVYLPKQRCCSDNTVRNYRIALNQMLEYVKMQRAIPLYEVTFPMLSKDSVSDFLEWIETERGCSAQTVNLRLAALRAFFTYAAGEEMTVCPLLHDLKKIPKKKCPKPVVEYMSEAAVKTLLRQPDITTPKGVRDQFLMILLYDTGARIQEIMNLHLKDFRLGETPTVILHGKGKKTRVVPIMDRTVRHLERYAKIFHVNEEMCSDAHLFYSRRNGQISQMTTENVRKIMKSYIADARRECPEVPERLHPHLWRHSRAMHLYQHGMDLSLISQWLGHTRMETTLIYAHADTEQKRLAIQKAMADSDPPLSHTDNLPSWRNDEDLIARLYGLK